MATTVSNLYKIICCKPNKLVLFMQPLSKQPNESFQFLELNINMQTGSTQNSLKKSMIPFVNVNSVKRAVFLLQLISVGECIPTPTSAIQPFESLSHNRFAGDIFYAIVEGNSFKNIVYSPASIHACMTLMFMGAEGETAEEMRQVLRLGKGDKEDVAAKFAKYLESDPVVKNQTDEVPELKMANHLYVSDKLQVAKTFKKLVLHYFDTQVEEVNFSDKHNVVEIINHWVAQQTENKIKNIVQEGSITSATNAVFVNAIHFKANWLNPFSQSSTSISKFYLNANISIEAEIMYNEQYYGYAELKELEATVLEMPYNNSDVSMLIILPNDIEGLENLELKLKNKDLNEIAKRLLLKKMHVYLPKFTIEFEIDLKEPLEKLGLTKTFTSSANFKSLFTTPEFQGISEAKHKAFLDVNEAGSEAAAATFATLTTLSASFDEPVFHADHPFFFAIRSQSAVYFAGHVATM